MSFADWMKKNTEDDEIAEAEIDVESGDIEEFNEQLEKITDSLNEMANKQAELNAKSAVKQFLVMDQLLFEQGYGDKDERLRIIEIIF